MKPSINRIMRQLERAKATRVAILCHQNADPDSVCSAYALGRLLALKGGFRCETVAEGGISKVSKILVEKLGLSQPKPNFIPDRFHAFCLVDAASLRRVTSSHGMLLGQEGPMIIVDHHEPDVETAGRADVICIDERATSVGEMVAQFYEEAGVSPPLRVRRALLAAIVFDTKHLMNASRLALRAVASLVDAGTDYSEIAGFMRIPLSESERLARLRAAQRMQVQRVGGFVIAGTEVGSFEASAARGLLMLGADVGIVASERKGEIRIVGRATPTFCQKTGIHLGRDVMRAVGKLMAGTGGGHAAAAAAKGCGVQREGLRLALSFLERLLIKEANKPFH